MRNQSSVSLVRVNTFSTLMFSGRAHKKYLYTKQTETQSLGQIVVATPKQPNPWLLYLTLLNIISVYLSLSLLHKWAFFQSPNHPEFYVRNWVMLLLSSVPTMLSFSVGLVQSDGGYRLGNIKEKRVQTSQNIRVRTLPSQRKRLVSGENEKYSLGIIFRYLSLRLDLYLECKMEYFSHHLNNSV